MTEKTVENDMAKCTETYISSRELRKKQVEIHKALC